MFCPYSNAVVYVRYDCATTAGNRYVAQATCGQPRWQPNRTPCGTCAQPALVKTCRDCVICHRPPVTFVIITESIYLTFWIKNVCDPFLAFVITLSKRSNRFSPTSISRDPSRRLQFHPNHSPTTCWIPSQNFVHCNPAMSLQACSGKLSLHLFPQPSMPFSPRLSARLPARTPAEAGRPRYSNLHTLEPYRTADQSHICQFWSNSL